jgi:hypothetical protein
VIVDVGFLHVLVPFAHVGTMSVGERRVVVLVVMRRILVNPRPVVQQEVDDVIVLVAVHNSVMNMFFCCHWVLSFRRCRN